MFHIIKHNNILENVYSTLEWSVSRVNDYPYNRCTKIYKSMAGSYVGRTFQELSYYDVIKEFGIRIFCYKRLSLEFILVLADERDLCFDARCNPRVVRSVVEAVYGLTVGVLLRLVGLEAVEERVAPRPEEFGAVGPEVSDN